jgi:energy-coupling factor transport system ATP-binding protein
MSLKADDISYFYADARAPALSAVSLGNKKGELAVACGKNGSGKSTLLRCLAGLAKPSQGSISIDDQAPEKMRRNIGFAIQFPERALFEKTVYDEIAFGPRNMRRPPRGSSVKATGPPRRSRSATSC